MGDKSILQDLRELENQLEEKLKNAQSKITNALLGIIVVVAAYAITSIVGKMLGFNILDIGTAINLLGPNP